MALKVERVRPMEPLISEAQGSRSVKKVTFSASTFDRFAGLVVGINSTTKEYSAYDPSASDGLEVVRGVLLNDVLANKTSGVIVSLDAVVDGGKLTYAGAVDDVISGLYALGVLVRGSLGELSETSVTYRLAGVLFRGAQVTYRE